MSWPYRWSAIACQKFSAADCAASSGNANVSRLKAYCMWKFQQLIYRRRGSLIDRISATVAAIFHRSQKPNPVVIDRLRVLFPEIVAVKSPIYRLSDLAALDPAKTAQPGPTRQLVLADLSTGTPVETMEFLVRSVDQDFEDGRVVVIDGWTLAKTEAHLLALILADGM